MVGPGIEASARLICALPRDSVQHPCRLAFSRDQGHLNYNTDVEQLLENYWESLLLFAILFQKGPEDAGASSFTLRQVEPSRGLDNARPGCESFRLVIAHPVPLRQTPNHGSDISSTSTSVINSLFNPYAFARCARSSIVELLP